MLCACQAVAVISSASVAPLGHRSGSKIHAFLLPRIVVGLSVFLAWVALTGFSFATSADFVRRVVFPALAAVVFGALFLSASGMGRRL